MTDKKYRLVTRSDFDGLVCAVLLKHLDLIEDIKFVHPKDMQDNKVKIFPEDITTNLPYVEQAHLCFDHHLSEILRNTEQRGNHIIEAEAPSAARVVWNYYGGSKTFPRVWNEMMDAVDKGDSAQYNSEEVLHPKGWELLNFIMDARTGLGRFHTFRISNYNLMLDLIDYCKDHGIRRILQLTDVKERVDLYFSHAKQCEEQIRRCSTVHNNLVILDLRDEEIIYSGNRFIIYALFPDCNISMHVMWGLRKMNTVFAVGKSIFDRRSKTNIGKLMLEYEGGGHEAAGTCQIFNQNSDEVYEQLVEKITSDG